MSESLRRQRYHELMRRSRVLIRCYLTKMTGLSRAQITRLIRMYLDADPVQPRLIAERTLAEAIQRF